MGKALWGYATAFLGGKWHLGIPKTPSDLALGLTPWVRSGHTLGLQGSREPLKPGTVLGDDVDFSEEKAHCFHPISDGSCYAFGKLGGKGVTLLLGQ